MIVTIISDLNVLELGTVQVRQVQRASLATDAYAKKVPLMREFFYTFFRAEQDNEALKSERPLPQTVLNFACRDLIATSNITTSSILKVLIFR